MVKERMDLLELLRKEGMDGDVDFLREALRVLVEGIMDAEVSGPVFPILGAHVPSAASLLVWRPLVPPPPHRGTRASTSCSGRPQPAKTIPMLDSALAISTNPSGVAALSSRCCRIMERGLYLLLWSPPTGEDDSEVGQHLCR